MSTKIYTVNSKRVLADGSIKIYTYQQVKIRPVNEKKILFNELKNNDEFNNIIKNKDLTKMDKFYKIYEFTSNNNRFRDLTKSQIKNLIYRL